MQPFIVLNDTAGLPAGDVGTLAMVQGTHLTVAYTCMRKGAVIPLHHHPEEAIDIVLEGELDMQVGEQKQILVRGMISIVPPNIPHTARAVTECKVVSIFYPKRS